MEPIKVIVLGCAQYSFEDQKTKRMVEGTTVHYVTQESVNEDFKVGNIPTKASLEFGAFNDMKGWSFPCLAEASITLDLTNNRNPIKVTGFKPIKSIAL